MSKKDVAGRQRGRAATNVEALESRRLLSGSVFTSAEPGPRLLSEPQATTAAVTTPRLVENLDRGVFATDIGNATIYVNWRLLGLDDPNLAFNVYRSIDGGAPVKLNSQPITDTTGFVDTAPNWSQPQTYSVRPILNGVEQPADGSYTRQPTDGYVPYHRIPLQKPAGGVTPSGDSYGYTANDTSVGDLDGDGQYEFVVKWEPTNARDNSQSGYTGNVLLDAYELDGTRLWRIDLGQNIRAGAHYTQFQVFDLDSDGHAEVALRTAPGTIDGQGNPVLLPGDNASADYRNSGGYILTGPEYLTVFDGLTGGELASGPFEPVRGSASQWGDSYGNRVDRFTAGVAYLDGTRPSLVFGRGYYGPQGGFAARNEVAAYDYRDGQLSLRWVFRASTNGPNANYIGQGAHSLTIGDVDQDGFDEVVYGAAVIDHDGTGLYSTGLGHGDALHLSDMDPTRPGQEIFMVHEDAGAYQSNGRDAGAELHDAATGQLLVQIPSNNDVGRGVAFDIDPNHLGYEMWGTTNEGTRFIYNVNGQPLYPTPSNMHYNFGLWWDADPLRETLDGTTISNWNWDTRGRQNILAAWQFGAADNNGTKANPALSGDLLGDWREEVIWRNGDSTELQLWGTNIPATSRMSTLMHDTQYRVAVAWQNSGYNQPPHPSFYLGAGMSTPPTPNVEYVEYDGFTRDGDEPGVYQAEEAVVGGVSLDSNNPGFNGSGFANFPTDGGFVEFRNVNGGLGGLTDVVLRYALGAAGTRTGNLVVNGVSTPITFSSTGDWTAWQTRTLRLDLLPGGANTIRFESIGQDLANLDQIAVDVGQLPAPWVTGYFGGQPAGGASYDDATFTVFGGGADIWGERDAFRYVYQDFSGDGQIVARIDGFDAAGDHSWSKAGLMIRGDLTDDAANAFIFLTGDNGVAFQTRGEAGAFTTSNVFANWDGPVWLRLARAGDVFTSFASINGTTWTTLGQATINLSNDAFVGMAVTSHNAATVSTATFSDVILSNLPTTAQAQTIVVNGGAAQRSMVRHLTVTFSQPISQPPAEAVSLVRRGGGGGAVAVTLEPADAAGRRWRIVPSAGALTNGSLPDGVYDLSIDPSRVIDPYGRPAAAGGTTQLTFHRLFADANGDRRVGLADFLALRAAFGTSIGDADFNDALDGDEDDRIGLADFLMLRQNFGKELIY